MLINCDVKSLEVVVAAELSQDEVLKDELRRKVDLHALNQARFKLPDRVTAKRFIFKLLYGATAYGYVQDSDFLDVKFNRNQWQAVIDEFYDKYKGIGSWHKRIEREAKENGFLISPSGRYYNFVPKRSDRGEWKWPLTQIKNYPVQGFGADLVMLARIKFFKEFIESGLEGYFIQTIHDSLVVDTPSKNVYNISVMLKEAVEAVPSMCKEYFNYDFTLPLTSEILVGPNKKDLEPYEFSSNN
jgi:DNA polymerase I-like protein with 3'-5' exonuclease and polymerase domains